ncbi:hypothetical protein CO695_18105 [Providencia alcalifaciens]|uniref:Uncharacterized protein n=2 Tax=Providencia TaxID=586 RepID=B6XIM3_9GAMM|nr:hypothetical protein [Providencia alcalifaciens]ATG18124.1 hypothetical protein CO695_18105 [Providencia alcalifaciens]EEB44711.1 hypothetical protein PROVALCAL_03218 [Providencia alcalifaciens DSM 30120]SQI33058.1 Uncharacterised protein [Providencia alcalifaciens]
MNMNMNMKVKFIFSIFILLISTLSMADNRPGFVCGRFNGNIVEVPRNYVYFIAEYEGYSYFDRRAVKNKEGCDANFTILPLRVTWPEMHPVDRMKPDLNEEEIRISVIPMTNSTASMNMFKDNSINEGFFSKRSDVYYDDELDLYFVEQEENILIKNEVESYIMKRRIYWSENKNEVMSIIRCDWVQIKNEYYFCDINARIPEIDASIQVNIKWNQMHQWRKILLKSKGFVIIHLK